MLSSIELARLCFEQARPLPHMFDRSRVRWLWSRETVAGLGMTKHTVSIDAATLRVLHTKITIDRHFKKTHSTYFSGFSPFSPIQCCYYFPHIFKRNWTALFRVNGDILVEI
jgi:hypothetical protein